MFWEPVSCSYRLFLSSCFPRALDDGCLIRARASASAIRAVISFITSVMNSIGATSHPIGRCANTCDHLRRRHPITVKTAGKTLNCWKIPGGIARFCGKIPARLYGIVVGPLEVLVPLFNVRLTPSDTPQGEFFRVRTSFSTGVKSWCGGDGYRMRWRRSL